MSRARNNTRGDGWGTLGEKGRGRWGWEGGFDVENCPSRWAVDGDDEWVAVIWVVKDPSCPACLGHASWTRPGPGSRWGRGDMRRRIKRGQISSM